MSLLRRKRRETGTRVLFATDVHGSEDCYRKFLRAGDMYSADVLILGGDIAGKLLVPIVRRNGTYDVTYGDTALRAAGRDEVDEVRTQIRRSGHYVIEGTPDEIAELNDPAILDSAFRKVVYDTLADWVALTEERLRGTGRRCFMAPGNDDFAELDDAIKGGDVVEFAEARTLMIDDVHEMITTGFSNPTPWDTERELPEPELKARLDEMVRDVRDPDNLLAVIHVPPYDSGLDMAPKIDDDLRVQGDAAGVATAPVGSTAVRSFMMDNQPLLGLHGHVHEGRGIARLGRTLCINPGSEYGEGIMTGALIELGAGEVISHQFVSG
jgi:Icc-related predicted phosphoesterase